MVNAISLRMTDILVASEDGLFFGLIGWSFFRVKFRLAPHYIHGILIGSVVRWLFLLVKDFFPGSKCFA